MGKLGKRERAARKRKKRGSVFCNSKGIWLKLGSKKWGKSFFRFITKSPVNAEPVVDAEMDSQSVR